MSVVHTLFDGRSEDISIEDLFPEGQPNLTVEGGGLLETTSRTAAMVKEALADHYDRPLSDFDEYQVIIEKNGNITVRQDANFG